MVYLSSVEEWQKQSALLLQARPATARITSKYNTPNLDAPKYEKAREKHAKQSKSGAGHDQNEPSAQLVPRGTFTLKTYDPESGITLKFKTDRAADIGRLVAGLGIMGRHMAALPEKAAGQDSEMEEAPSTEVVAGTGTGAANKAAPSAGSESRGQGQNSGSGGGGSGGKKKKKGKK